LADTAGRLMLSLVAGPWRGTIDLRALASIAIGVEAFVGFCYLIGAGAVRRIMRWVDDGGLAEHAGMSVMVGNGMIIATQAASLMTPPLLSGLLVTPERPAIARP
jgi:hypothetical protein